MCGYHCRGVRPVHIVSIGPGDMLQFLELHGLGLDAQASVRLTSHIGRAFEPLDLGVCRLQLQPYSSTHAYSLSEVQDAAEVADGGRMCIASHAWASSHILYDYEQRTVGRMLACVFGLLQPSVQFETDIKSLLRTLAGVSNVDKPVVHRCISRIGRVVKLKCDKDLFNAQFYLLYIGQRKKSPKAVTAILTGSILVFPLPSSRIRSSQMLADLSLR